MQLSIILKVSNIIELKSLGSFYDVKNSLEKELDNKLGVTGWKSLFNKINGLKFAISANKSYLLNFQDNGSFKELRTNLSKLLDLKISARSYLDLKVKIEKLVNIFCSNVFDPYDYYEKTKLIKFKSSSKLEGINLEMPSASVSLESVLAKYKR